MEHGLELKLGEHLPNRVSLREVLSDACERVGANRDIWLHAQALRVGYRVRPITPRSLLFPRLPGTQEVGLKYGNVMSDSGNDQQARLTYSDADLQLLRSETRAGEKQNAPEVSLGDRIRTAWHAAIYG